MSDKEQEIRKIRKKRNRSILLLVIVLLTLTVGFALLSSTFNIKGTSKILNSEWDIHFENLVVKNGSVEPVVGAKIADDELNITYTVDLEKPGDFYEFSVDVVNEGTIDAILKELPEIVGVSEEQDKYVNYSFTHTDGSLIVAGEELKVGDSENFTVRIEYDNTITDDSQLPKEDQTLQLDVTMVYDQK